MSTAYSSAKQQYIGNGVTTEWGFDFPIKKHSELKVYLKRSTSPQVLLEEGVDYSFVTDNTITFPIKTGEAKLQAADVLALQRESVFESEYNFSNQQRLEPEEVMHADDNLERQIQELKRDVSQAIRIQPTSNIDTDEYFVAVESIYENLDNITNVSGISAEIVNCSDNISDISTVSSNIANVNAVGQSISNVNTVANNISDVNTAALNIEAIKDAPNQANAASQSASDASQSATNAANSATASSNSAIDSANSATASATSAQAAQDALNDVHGLIATPIGTIFQSVYVDESLDIARQLNGQLISSTKFTGFRSWLNTVQTATPNLFTTETNWQAEKTNSKLGQCGKFVIDDTAGTIRLPCVVNAQGLADLALIGGIKSESLPNISGYINNTSPSGQNYSEGGSLYWQDKNYNYPSVLINATDKNYAATIRLDASRSSSTYQDNAPVQQEAVQYPYYIQVATGVEETLPAIREYNINTPFFFGQSMYSDVAPDNASWLASNGQYNAKTVYPDYYDWLVEQRNAGIKPVYLWHLSTDAQVILFVTETDTLSVDTVLYGYSPNIRFGKITAISGNDVTIRNDLTNQTYTQSADVNNPTAGSVYIYNSSKINVITKEELDGWRIPINTSDYDFVINTSDQTFRLPLLNGEEDLPGNTFSSMTYNGHGSVYTAPKNGHFSLYGYGSAAYIYLHNETSSDYSDCFGSTESSSPCGVSVKCKKGDAIRAGYYGGTITTFGFAPAVGNGSLYYYVGDTVQDASLINAGAVLGQFSNKADIDASNFNADGKSLLSGLGMPSGRYIDLTLGASGSNYTAPANGWFILTMSGATNGVHLSRIDGFGISYNPRGDGFWSGVLPVRKSDTIVCYYGAGTSTAFRFIYAEGEN